MDSKALYLPKKYILFVVICNQIVYSPYISRHNLKFVRLHCRFLSHLEHIWSYIYLCHEWSILHFILVIKSITKLYTDFLKQLQKNSYILSLTWSDYNPQIFSYLDAFHTILHFEELTYTPTNKSHCSISIYNNGVIFNSEKLLSGLWNQHLVETWWDLAVSKNQLDDKEIVHVGWMGSYSIINKIGILYIPIFYWNFSRSSLNYLW